MHAERRVEVHRRAACARARRVLRVQHRAVAELRAHELDEIGLVGRDDDLVAGRRRSGDHAAHFVRIHAVRHAPDVRVVQQAEYAVRRVGATIVHADGESARRERVGDDPIDLVENLRPHVHVRPHEPVQLGAAHAVGHRVEIRRRAVHDVAEAAVFPVLRQRLRQMDFAGRRLRAERHLRARKHIRPPVRAAGRIDIQGAAEIDANAGGAAALGVRERAEHGVKLREHARPRRLPPQTLTRIDDHRLAPHVGIGQPAAHPVANRAARRRTRDRLGRERRGGAVPLRQPRHCGAMCVCTS